MRAIIALGSNLGDRFDYLQKALRAIDDLQSTEITNVSNVYETLPVGGPTQDNYLNAVSSLETTLSASDLLTQLLIIETNLGRQREVIWGPRTIDLDLVKYESEIINSENLVLPHPRAFDRCFVVKPWLEVEQEGSPIHKKLSETLAHLDCSGVEIFSSKLNIQ